VSTAKLLFIRREIDV
jgi:DNA repair exonuclease SbcCD ATPase subunit